MELQAVADKTHLPIRKLRYVLDHQLLPGLRVKVDTTSVGRPRLLTDFEAFGVACAAALLVGGVRRDGVIEFMEGLAALPWEEDPRSKPAAKNSGKIAEKLDALAFYAAFSKRIPMIALLGDGVNIRVQGGAGDTGWRQPRTLARLSEDYQPTVIVQVDLGRLRSQLKGQAFS